MVKHYTSEERGRIGEKILDLGNIAGGGMLFGQFLSENPFNYRIAIFGLLVMVLLYLIGLRIIRGGE